MAFPNYQPDKQNIHPERVTGGEFYLTGSTTVYWGPPETDGSIRMRANLTIGAIIFEKRVLGTWVSIGSIM